MALSLVDVAYLRKGKGLTPNTLRHRNILDIYTALYGQEKKELHPACVSIAPGQVGTVRTRRGVVNNREDHFTTQQFLY
jgi:hypothetical protein